MASDREAQLAYEFAQFRVLETYEADSPKLDLSISGLRSIPPLLGLDPSNPSPDKTLASDRRHRDGLTALQSLDLTNAQVSDLAPLAGLTALQSLNLRSTQVSDLAPLAGLTALQSLNLRGTQVSDLAPLAGLTALQSLNLRGTQVSDLAPLAGLTALQSLDLESTRVSDLAPLAGLTALQSIDLAGTQVFDLAPLAGLTSLGALCLSHTHISDVAPLAGLTALQSLDLWDSNVSDLAPLAGLTALQSLDLGYTQVSDLTPLAGLSALIEGAKRPEHRGLSFPGCPILDKQVLSFASLENPERTERTINHLRAEQDLPPYEPAQLEDTVRDSEEADDREPPQLPSQGPGPRYAIKANGLVSRASLAPLDRQGNDVSRLRKLHGPLREAAQDFLDSFRSGGANDYPQLFKQAQAYLSLANTNLEDLDFTLLYAAGLRLLNARAAVERQIKQSLAPPLEDHQFEALKSLTTIHGLVISATAEGQALLDDADRFDTKREDAEATRQDILSIVEPLATEPDVVEPSEPQLIAELAKENAPIDHPERRAAYTIAATSNLLIVVGGYSLLALLLGSGDLVHAIELLIGTGAHSTMTRRGRDARHFARILIEDGLDLADEKVQAALRNGASEARTFILRHQETLRRLASRNQRFAFLIDILDWLKSRE